MTHLGSVGRLHMQWASISRTLCPWNGDSTCSEDGVESSRRPGSVRTSLTTEEVKARDRTSTRHGPPRKVTGHANGADGEQTPPLVQDARATAEVYVQATTTDYMNGRSAHMFNCDCHFGSSRRARAEEPVLAMIPVTSLPKTADTSNASSMVSNDG